MTRARAAGAVVLLVVVAAAAGAAGGRGTAPGASGAGGGLGVPNWAGSLVLAFLGAVAAVLCCGLVASLIGNRRPRRPRGAAKKPLWAWLAELAVAALAALLMLGLVYLVAHGSPHGLRAPGVGAPLRLPVGAYGHLAARQGAAISWLPLAVGAALALGAFASYKLLARRRGAKLATMEKLARDQRASDETRRQAVAALDLSLEALWAEPDPRKAVIAAYGRMENWLAHVGMGRRASEAPFEHLGRVMGWLGASASVGAALAQLFERAKFDQRPCGEQMKQEALGALALLRDELSGLRARA